MWAAPFDATRSADAKYDKERDVRLLRMMLTGDETLKYERLYKLLPPYSAVKSYYSPGGAVNDMVPDGVYEQGFILKPTAVGGPMKN
jgi:hypothetical protein